MDDKAVSSTRAKALTDRLDSADALARHLRALLRRDPRLKPVAKAAGGFEVRLVPGGFAGLARVVCGQQLSVPSANAIWSRFAALPGALEPRRFLRLTEARVRAAGFSAGKYRTVRVIAEAVVGGALDFELVERLPPDEASAYLTAHKGIGPWTADIYLMFCAGHPDIFPVGDLALRKAVGHALGMSLIPSTAELTEIAAGWSPHRHTAALLFWRYCGALQGKAGAAP